MKKGGNRPDCLKVEKEVWAQPPEADASTLACGWNGHAIVGVAWLDGPADSSGFTGRLVR